MELTACESICFFGMWDQSRTMFAWDDVKSLCCSWKTLRNDFHFSRENLQRMQPDKCEWIKRGALTLHDLVDMSIFLINPISDLHADLAEIWLMHWTADEIKMMCIIRAVAAQRPQRCHHAALFVRLPSPGGQGHPLVYLQRVIVF